MFKGGMAGMMQKAKQMRLKQMRLNQLNTNYHMDDL